MRPRDSIAAWSAVAAVVAVAAAGSWLLPLDLQLYGWLQQYRPSDAHVVAHALDLAARTALALVIGTFVLGDRRQLRTLVESVPLVITGAAFGELLKTAIERLRPSALPDMVTGNSMPSGHIMNTTLFAVVAWELADSVPSPVWRRLARGTAVAAVVAQSAARVLKGSHWPSDVAPSVLVGVAWMLGTGSIWRTRIVSAPVLGAMLAAYVFFAAVPAARLHVPSVLDRPRTTLATLDLGGRPFALDPAGNWSSSRSGLDLGFATLRAGGAPDAFEAVMRSGCEAPTAHCSRVRVALNGWLSPEIALGCEWRWYHVRPIPEVLRAGENTVAIILPDGCAADDIRDVDVRSLALVTDDTVVTDHVATSDPPA